MFYSQIPDKEYEHVLLHEQSNNSRVNFVTYCTNNRTEFCMQI